MPKPTTQESTTQARRKTPRRAFLFVNDRLLDKFYADFGMRVREVRAQQGLTQEALAEMAEISRPYLAQIEAGKRHMALHVAWNVANALHFSIDELFGTD